MWELHYNGLKWFVIVLGLFAILALLAPSLHADYALNVWCTARGGILGCGTSFPISGSGSYNQNCENPTACKLPNGKIYTSVPSSTTDTGGYVLTANASAAPTSGPAPLTVALTESRFRCARRLFVLLQLGIWRNDHRVWQDNVTYLSHFGNEDGRIDDHCKSAGRIVRRYM